MQPTRKRRLIDAAAVLLGSLTLLTAPKVQSQDSSCSNYWINPQTGKKECLNRSLSNPGNALSGRDFHRLRRQLNQHYTMGRIRVFYNTSGKHAVDPADRNQNRIPDQVENVAKQTWAAYQLFVETLNFPDPLKSERYRQASWIDVNLLAKATINRNGVAYDELQNFRRPVDSLGTKTITFDVATSVNAATNITPAHELFHLIQYGASYFKNRWYTEGMARWAEHALQKGGLGQIRYDAAGRWPQPKTNRRQLFERTYDAEFYLWNPLAQKDDPQGMISSKAVGSKVKTLTYANGKKVLRDFRLQGADFMREVLIALGKMDEIAYQELGYSSWLEKNQKSQQNNAYIYQAIMDAARQRGHAISSFRTNQ
jgi:hypothetical protein